MFRVVILTLALATLADITPLIAAVASQDEPEVPTAIEEVVAGYYPDPAVLGEGWAVRQTEVIPDLDTSVFRAGVVQRLGGPNGSRATLRIFILVDPVTTQRRGWDAGVAILDRQVTEMSSVTADANDLVSLAPPAGCAQAQRAEGFDIYDYSASYTLCAVDAGALLLGYLAGELDDLSGVQSSDRLVQTAISAGIDDQDGSPVGTAAVVTETEEAPVGDQPPTETPLGSTSARISSFQVEGLGMEPTLHDGDVVDIEPLDSGQPLTQGDIVLFVPPLGEDLLFVKRVLALPGQLVQIRDGGVYVDGERLTENYVDGMTTECSASGACDLTIPIGTVYVLGDNRSNSIDSRYFGPVPIDLIIGVVSPS